MNPLSSALYRWRNKYYDLKYIHYFFMLSKKFPKNFAQYQRALRCGKQISSVCKGVMEISRSPLGCAIAQAVSSWLPTAAARVRVGVWSCGVCGGQSGDGAGFLRVLRFPLSIFIPPVAPKSPSSIIWGWYITPVVTEVPSGLSLTQLRIKKRSPWIL
jgi:hypothetical protein